MTDTTQTAVARSRGVDAPRRRWSEAHKRRVVAESYRSGETVSEVAQRHGVHSSLLFRWRRRYRKAPESGPGFVPVVVEAPEVVSAGGAGRMEIVLGEDVRVVVDATVHGPTRTAWRASHARGPAGTVQRNGSAANSWSRAATTAPRRRGSGSPVSGSRAKYNLS